MKYVNFPEKLYINKAGPDGKLVGWIFNPRILSENGLCRMKRSSLKRQIWFRLLKRTELNKINKFIRKTFLISIRRNQVLQFINLIFSQNTSLFQRRDNDIEENIFSSNYECWAYNIIDTCLNDYGWSIEYTLNQKYVILLELMSTANNRRIMNKMSAVSAALSGHGGSTDVFKILKGQLMRRKVSIPVYKLREHDEKERKKLNQQLSGNN